MTANCPSPEQLQALLRGHLPPADEALLAQHVSECIECQRRLEVLAGSIAINRKDTSQKPGASPLLEQAIAKLNKDTIFIPPAKVDPALAAGTRIQYFGDYEILEELGRGGMGVVYKARQVSLNRFVAIKLILAGQLASEMEVRRFRTEAEAVAKLDHPNIVPIYEIGENEGRHYFSMKWVEGGSLAESLSRSSRREEPLTSQAEIRNARSDSQNEPPHVGCYEMKELAALVATIARAVHYAHQRGVLHRDLKPSNILIDREGQPHLTDFGLAKMLEHDSGLTHSAAIMGTPNYLAPEMAAGKAKEVTTAVDVFSLGAILYELLTGRPPFQEENIAATLQKVIHAEPLRPALLNRVVPRDLETICLKCLEKEPDRRYGSAEALADDLARFCRDEPISARSTNLSERTWRWCRRKPALALSLASLMVILFLGMGGVLWQWKRAEQNAELETRQRQRAESIATHLTTQRAEDLFESGDSRTALAHLARIVRSQPTNRVAAVRLLAALTQRTFSRRMPIDFECDTNVSRFDISSDGKHVATFSQSGTIQIWDSLTGKALMPGTQISDAPNRWLQIQFSPDNELLAVASGDRLYVLAAHTGEILVGPIPHRVPRNAIAEAILGQFSADGQRLVTTGRNTVHIRDPRGGTQLIEIRVGTQVDAAWISPDGQRIVAIWAKTAQVWDASTGRPITAPVVHPAEVAGAQFSSDGSRFFTVDSAGALRLWDCESGQLLRQAPHDSTAPFQDIASAQFSPDGERIAFASFDRICRIWDTRTEGTVATRLKDELPVVSVQFTLGGDRIVTVSRKTARVWDARTGHLLIEPIPISITNPRLVRPSPDGLKVFAASGKNVQMWDVSPKRMLPLSWRKALKPGVELDSVRFTLDGQRLVTTFKNWNGPRDFYGWPATTEQVWDARTGKALSEPLKFDDSAVQTWLMENERSGITVSSNTVVLWDAHTKKPLFEPLLHDYGVIDTAVTPDGYRLATASRDKTVRIWDTRTGRLFVEPLLHEVQVKSISFSADGQLLLTIAWEGIDTTGRKSEIRVWDANTGRLLAGPLKYAGRISAGFSPDNQCMLVSSADRTAQILEARTGRALAKPMQHNDSVSRPEFSLDGLHLATLSGNGFSSVWRVWDAQTGQLLRETIRPQGNELQNKNSFSSSGVWPWVLCGDTARAWDMWTGLPLTEPMAYGKQRVSTALSRDGRWLVVGSSPDANIRIWELPMVGASAPPWLANLAEALAGIRINSQGIVELVPEADLDALTRRWAGVTPANDDERWIQWFFADPATRSISPSSPIMRSEYIQRQIDEDTLESLREAALLSSTNALTFARLSRQLAAQNFAAYPGALGEADWSSRYAVRLAPNDTEVLRIREGVVKKLGISAKDRGASREAKP